MSNTMDFFLQNTEKVWTIIIFFLYNEEFINYLVVAKPKLVPQVVSFKFKNSS
jgi:hypothetical protein